MLTANRHQAIQAGAARRLLAVVALVVGVLLTLPTPANAGTIETGWFDTTGDGQYGWFNEGVYVFHQGDPGENNDIRVTSSERTSEDGSFVEIELHIVETNPGATLRQGSPEYIGCEYGERRATCTVAVFQPGESGSDKGTDHVALFLDLGDGNDVLDAPLANAGAWSLGYRNFGAFGGSGDDVIRGTHWPNNDSFGGLMGGPGNDVIEARGRSELRGGADYDLLRAKNGVGDAKIDCEGEGHATRDSSDPPHENCSPDLRTSVQARFRGSQSDSSRVGFRKGRSVIGTLRSETGSRLGGQTLSVVERFNPGAAEETRTHRVRTDDEGGFRLDLAPGPSRDVQVIYPGVDYFAPSESNELTLEVKGRVSLKAKRKVRAGGRVKFRGRVARHPGVLLPDGGKLVEVQVRVGGGWKAVSRAKRTQPNGGYKLGYRFGRFYTRPVTFRFRTRLISEQGWPYARAISKKRKVTVVPARR
jgi:hypothetical protein